MAFIHLNDKLHEKIKNRKATGQSMTGFISDMFDESEKQKGVILNG